MSGVELAACPFCGGEAREPIDYAGFTGCAAFGCPGSNVVALPEAWNRRAVPMEAVAWRFEEWGYAHQDWLLRLTHDRPVENRRTRNIQALALIPQAEETVK